MNRNVCFFIYFIFLVLTARDIFSKWNESLEKATKGRGGAGASPDGAVVGGVNAEPQEDLLDDELGAPKKSIPSMSFQSTGDPSSTPTIKITYCYSCGYAKAFEEYSKMLMSRFPTINVIGGHHNPGFLRSALSQILSYGKLTLIFVLVVGIDPFVMAGQPAPRVWTWMKEHKINACMILFFLTNTFESLLMSSGAFEIYYNDVRIWSKIETGRVPTANELFELVNSQLRQYYQGDTMFGEDSLHTIPGRKF